MSSTSSTSVSLSSHCDCAEVNEGARCRFGGGGESADRCRQRRPPQRRRRRHRRRRRRLINSPFAHVPLSLSLSRNIYVVLMFNFFSSSSFFSSFPSSHDIPLWCRCRRRRRCRSNDGGDGESALERSEREGLFFSGEPAERRSLQRGVR